MKQYPNSSATENGSAKIKARSQIVSQVICITILTFCLTLGLSACGGSASGGKPSERTEKQISEDVQAQDDFISAYNLKVDSFSISKRQTNQEDKTDFVWCTVTASNNTLSYSAEYELTYVLYNDGWLLEEYMQESSSVTPKSMLTQDEAIALVVTYFEQTHDLSSIAEYRLNKKSALKTLDEFTYAYYFQFYYQPVDIYKLTSYPDYVVYYKFDFASGEWNSEVDSVFPPLWWN